MISAEKREIVINCFLMYMERVDIATAVSAHRSSVDKILAAFLEDGSIDNDASDMWAIIGNILLAHPMLLLDRYR
jgi:hypothetical protein